MSWASLLPLLVGAALTLVAGIVGSRFQAMSEHKKWLRERRFDTYVAFATYTDNATELIEQVRSGRDAIGSEKFKISDELHAERKALSAKKNEVFAPLTLLGPKSVSDAAKGFIDALGEFPPDKSTKEKVSKARKEYMEAMRKVLDVDY
ncbi:hypothetical protein V6S02_09495 [Microbacterium sp. CCNWLW134]|uniref:hypothetical protein n=1 Tax=Microbacterium sp. CCNWLW134 TaxID=3122064 RepID=UPI00300F986E